MTTRHGAATSVVLRLAAVVLVAVGGPAAAVVGVGNVVVYPPVARSGIVLVAGLTGVWAAVTWLVPNGWPRWLADAAFAGGILTATAANVGRAQGLSVLVSAVVLRSALVDGIAADADDARPPRPSLLAVMCVGIVGIGWAKWSSLAVHLAGIAAVMGYLAACRSGQPWALRAEGWVVSGWCWLSSRRERVTRTVAASAGRVARGGRVAGGSALREFGSDRSRVLRVLASALVGALWSPVLWRLATRGEAYTVLGINDFPLHVEVAERTTLIPLHIESPHLLFHVGVALTRGVVGLQAAPTFVVGLAVAATAWMVMWCFVDGADGPALTPGRAIVVACVFFLSESPAAVAAWAGWIGPTQPFMTLHWWGNPTWLVALPSAVGALVVATRLFAAAPARLRGMRSGVPLAVVVGVGALAKPAFVLCLLPGLVLFAVANRRTVSRAHVLATLPAVAVGTIVLVWQMWFLAESPDSKFSSGWTFDPIVAPVYGWGRIGLVFLLPLLLPALAATWCRRSFLARISVRLLLACTVFAAAIMLCINETGERSTHGNFAVPMQTCATLLVVAAIKELSIAVPEQLRTLGGVRRWAAIGATTGAAAVFMAGGAVTYAGAMGIVSDRVRWEQGAVRDEPLGGYDPHPAHALREAIGHASASPPP